MLPYKQSRAHAQRTCKNHTANIMPPFLDTDLAADWPEDATEHHAHHFLFFLPLMQLIFQGFGFLNPELAQVGSTAAALSHI